MNDGKTFLQRIDERNTKTTYTKICPEVGPLFVDSDDPVTAAWTKSTFNGIVNEVATAVERKPGRNTTLYKAAIKAHIKLVQNNLVPEQKITDALYEAAHTCGLHTDKECGPQGIRNSIASGYVAAQKIGPQPVPSVKNPDVNEVPIESFGIPHLIDAAELAPQPGETLENIEEDFWEARNSLKLIYQAALSQMCAPWAVLACCTARALTLIPPSITLPPIIGGPGSLNWYAAIVAKSGGGKGAANAVAARLIPQEIIIRGIGSGEGMIETYQRSTKGQDPPPPVTSVLFSVDEIDTLGAMGGRSGQTTMTIVRQGFSGETLGLSYRGRQTETVTAHTYRMTMLASVQPERAGVLFDDAGGGTPQRFMWFHGRDRRITATPPQWPTDKTGRPRVVPLMSARELAKSVGVILIPDVAATTIREARAASMNGDDNALDSHALFAREKFAYALAFLDARTEISEDDWRLSGIAANVSDWCRTKAQEGYLEGKHRQSRERGSLRAIEDDERSIVEKETYAKHLHRLIAWIVKTLTESGPLTPGDLNRKASGRDRSRLAAALTTAQEHALVDLVDGKWVLA